MVVFNKAAVGHLGFNHNRILTIPKPLSTLFCAHVPNLMHTSPSTAKMCPVYEIQIDGHLRLFLVLITVLISVSLSELVM